MRQRNIIEILLSNGFYIAHYIDEDLSLKGKMSNIIDELLDVKNKISKISIVAGRALRTDKVFSLIVKNDIDQVADFDSIYDAMIDMREQCEDLGVKKLAIPYTDMDDMSSDAFKETIKNIFSELDLNILFYKV